MKKKIISIFSVSLFLVLFTNCSNNLSNKIINELDSRIINQHLNKVSLKGITEDSDSIMILQPYSNVKKIEEKLNIDLDKIMSFGIEKRDDIYLFLFFKNRIMLDYTTIAVDKYYFYLDSKKMYSKDYLFDVKLDKGIFSEGKYIISDSAYFRK